MSHGMAYCPIGQQRNTGDRVLKASGRWHTVGDVLCQERQGIGEGLLQGRQV